MKTTTPGAHLFHFKTQVPELDRLLNPSATYASPEDVLRDSTLALSEKKAVLASWASDACAIDSKPAWRQPPGYSRPVAFDEIMTALQELDRSFTSPKDVPRRPSAEQNRSPLSS